MCALVVSARPFGWELHSTLCVSHKLLRLWRGARALSRPQELACGRRGSKTSREAKLEKRARGCSRERIRGVSEQLDHCGSGVCASAARCLKRRASAESGQRVAAKHGQHSESRNATRTRAIHAAHHTDDGQHVLQQQDRRRRHAFARVLCALGRACVRANCGPSRITAQIAQTRSGGIVSGLVCVLNLCFLVLSLHAADAATSHSTSHSTRAKLEKNTIGETPALQLPAKPNSKPVVEKPDM